MNCHEGNVIRYRPRPEDLAKIAREQAGQR
jgi:hypothetical protein